MNNILRVLDFRAKQDYSLFIQWFVDEWKKQGGQVRKDVKLKSGLRAFLSRLLCINVSKKGGPLIVCGSHRIETMAWPFNLDSEIIPMMWDLWPGYYDAFERFVKRNRVRLAFCTARQSVMAMQSRCPNTRFVWIPEAVNVEAYADGGLLRGRPVDILNYGRSIGTLSEEISAISQKNGWCFQQGIRSWSFSDLQHDLSAAKISICFPNCDTNPQKCCGVETLTIRYWEAMLSGTLIVGRAPRELVDVCGYDPVIESNGDIGSVLMRVLSNLDAYQELAVRNRTVALARGGWTDRIELIKREVEAGGAVSVS